MHVSQVAKIISNWFDKLSVGNLWIVIISISQFMLTSLDISYLYLGTPAGSG